MSAFTSAGPITKVNEERRQAFGWAYVSRRGTRDVIDHSGEYIPIDELEKAVYPFIKSGAVAGEMHRKLGVGSLIESFVLSDEKIKAMGLPEDTPRGWFVGVEYHDDSVWKKVKSGKYRAFSIHGRGVRTKVSKSRTPIEKEAHTIMPELKHLISGVELDELSLVDSPDDPEARVLLIKRREEATKEDRMNSVIGKSRSELARAHEALVSRYEAQGLSPVDAWKAARESSAGQQIMTSYEAAPVEEPMPRVAKQAVAGSPEVVEINKKADEIRAQAAAVGERLTPAEAYARAMHSEQGLVRAYYSR